MEGIALTLLGAAIFSHAWYFTGIYAEGRSVGVIMAALGVGLLITLTIEPQILGHRGPNLVLRQAEVTVFKGLILLWMVYAFAVAANGLWDFEERAVGFYGIVLTAGSAIAIFYYGTQLGGPYGFTVMIAFLAPALVLATVGALIFVFLAVPLYTVRFLSAWLMLIGSVIVTGSGLAVMSTVVAAPPLT